MAMTKRDTPRDGVMEKIEQVDELLSSGEANSLSEACKTVGMGVSTYYRWSERGLLKKSKPKKAKPKKVILEEPSHVHDKPLIALIGRPEDVLAGIDKMFN